MQIKTFFMLGFFMVAAAQASSYPLSTEQIGIDNKDEGMTIQRYKLIGATKDGSKIAVLLSHFGFSSRALFVNLMVKDHGNSSMETIDYAFSFVGGESDLVAMGDAIIEKNASSLKEHGIIIDNNAAESVTYFYEYAETVIRGAIDLKDNGKTEKFSIKLVADTQCPEGHNWKLCFSKQCMVVSDENSCATSAFMMQSIQKIGSYLWFFGQRKLLVFDSAVTAVDFAGIKLE